jgi:hypothetical protein
MSITFHPTVENELGVIRLAELKHDDVLWNIKSTQRGGLVISRDDDGTHVSLRVPRELLVALVREMATQVEALEDQS